MRIDYHVHTDNSMDCKAPMATMCEAAVAIGIQELAFTDHLNSHTLDMDLGYYNADHYFEDIERCRAMFPDLTIRAGVEVGEPHRFWKRVQPILDSYPYDLVLGSVHWVGNESVFDANYYRARQPQDAFAAYFSEMARMVEHGGFDIAAHIDVVKRTSFGVYGAFDTHQFQDMLCAVWSACLKANITPEINTRSLRLPCAELHPATDALRWYAEMGGKRLTFGSDAHHPESVGGGMIAARDSALAAGLKHVSLFEGRKIIRWAAL